MMQQAMILIALFIVLGGFLIGSYCTRERMSSLGTIITRLRAINVHSWFFAPPQFSGEMPDAEQGAARLGSLAISYQQWGKLMGLKQWDTTFAVTAARFTSYTIIAVPALIYKAGAFGYYTMIYSIIANVLILVAGPLLWRLMRPTSMSSVIGNGIKAKPRVPAPFWTPPDMVDYHFGDETAAKVLSTGIALVQVIASILYFALQIYAIDLFLVCLGIKSEIPLILLFLVFALLVYVFGLQHFARQATMKVVLLTLASALLLMEIVPQMGGIHAIFSAIQALHPQKLVLPPHQLLSYMTVAITSAFALFLYPHNMIVIAAAKDETANRQSSVRSSIFLYFTLCFALLGFAALLVNVPLLPFFQENSILPLVIKQRAAWLTIPVFSIFIYSSFVSALPMSVSCGNLIAHHFYVKWFRPLASDDDRFTAARIASLLVKVGAVAVMLFVLQTTAMQLIVNLFLIGNIIMLQVIPTLFFGWRLRCSALALLIGLVGGLILDIALGIPTLHNSPLVGNITLGPLPPMNIGLLGLGANVGLTIIAEGVVRLSGAASAKEIVNRF